MLKPHRILILIEFQSCECLPHTPSLEGEGLELYSGGTPWNSGPLKFTVSSWFHDKAEHIIKNIINTYD